MNFWNKLKSLIIASVSGLAIIALLLLPASPIFAQSISTKNDSQTFGIVFAVPENLNVQQIAGGYDFTAHHIFSINRINTYTANVNSQQFNDLKNHAGVVYAEIDTPVYASEIKTNDPYFTTDDLDADRQWYLDKIKIPQAWEYSKGSRDVKVAIVDTGIHADHLELNDGRIEAGYDITLDQPISADSNSDDNGHGTAVAGVIGAIPNNERGIAGVNWQVGIIPIKALDADGTGSISSVASGIVWAADHDVDIINLSLGGAGFGNDQTLNNSIIYAYQKGALIVSAAGNDLADHGINLDTNPAYPICADGGDNMVIGVLATDVMDRKANFSNYGVNCVDISAPGKRILTSAYLPSEPSDNILIYGSGTSLATPLVSGVAALLKARNMSLTNAEIKKIILSTADNIDGINKASCLGSSCNGFLGHGRLNAFSALSPQPLLNGAVVKEAATGVLYYIDGGKKRFLSNFVFTQRGFATSQILTETNDQLSYLPLDTPLPPLDGTLVKGQTDPLVYYIHQGLKRPLTYLVFQSRGFSFAKVQVMSDAELITIPTGEWYWPPDGVMVLVKGNPTVYVMDAGVKRPVTYFVFMQRKLSFNRVVNVTNDEFGHIPSAPDIYWLPPVDGTLIKTDTSTIVYLVVDGARRALTYDAFTNRGFKFSAVKSLPKAELDVIAPGPILEK